MVLSSAEVPKVPLTPFPGQAHRPDPSQVPADAQRPPLLSSGSLAVKSAANTVTLTSVYYKLIHSFRSRCLVTACHSDRPGS